MTEMEKKERKEMIESVAEQFTGMDDNDKSFITGYMVGKAEERQKWKKEQEATA